MGYVTRRNLLKLLGINLCTALMLNRQVAAMPHVKVGEATDSKQVTVEEWMDAWMHDSRALDGTLHVGRFVEPVYFLTRSIGWKPNRDETALQPVQVPKGFVTDFASIPWQFWSFLRPDGEYTYPAIIHDFLYWQQNTARDVADEIFKLGMEDLKLSPVKVSIMYQAVRFGGQSAWNENAMLKKHGEKRVLKHFPDDPTIRWLNWKAMPNVFEP